MLTYINNRLNSDINLRIDLEKTVASLNDLLPCSTDEMLQIGKLGLYPAFNCAPFITRQGTPFYPFDNMAMMPKSGPTMHYGDLMNFRQLEILFNMPRIDNAEAHIWLRDNLFQGCRIDARKKSEYKAKFRSQHRTDWPQIQVDWMKYCLNLKYRQWKEFQQLLDATEKLPVENGTNTRYPSRLYWGAELVTINNQEYFFGCNTLGKLLSQLRSTKGNLPYILPNNLHLFGLPILPL